MSLSIYSYTFKPGARPVDIREEFTRGDKYSISFLAYENDSETPFNLGVFDSFKCQLRIGSALNKNILAELAAGDFVLGQSQEALDYEVAESLPAGSIYDELHCYFQSALLVDVKVKKLLLDVQGIEGLDVTTFGSGSIKLNFDVTR